MSKILISGEWLWDHYQEACSSALVKLGHEVIKFGWQQHFFERPAGRDPHFKSFMIQRQNKYLVGPLISGINRDLISLASDTKPEIIWLYNDTHIFPRTIEKLRRDLPSTVLAQYANDNPWGKNQSAITWRHFKKAVPFFDINFYYRPSNEKDFEAAGARETALLRSYYIPEDIYPIERHKIEDEFRSDVVFVGHFENDDRLDMLTEIVRAGFNLKVFGTAWDKPISRLPRDNPLRRLLPVRPARGEQYRKAICGSRIALAFLSKLNEDSYTRRSFEIPAMKTFMLSEYTDDLNSLLAEGKEAEYFRSKGELMEKILYYLGHDDQIAEIARCGYDRVRKDGHDVTSRMEQFMHRIQLVKK